MKKYNTKIDFKFKQIITLVLVFAMIVGILPNGFVMDVKGSESSENWDYSVEFKQNCDDSTYLNQAFDAYDFTAYDNTTVSAKKEPSDGQDKAETGLGWWSDAWSSNTGFGSGNPGYGYLKPVLDRKVNMLTYTQSAYSNFYTEYTFVPGWSAWGISFGAAQGAFPITWDGDSSNDTGVALFYKNDGRLYIGGAVNTTTVKEATGKTVTFYEAETNEVADAAYLQYADAILVRLHNTDKASNEQTLCVEVYGDTLTVWEKSLPENVVTVKLTSNYQGGYVSLLSNQKQHGGFKDFAIKTLPVAIKTLPEEHNFNDMGLPGLNNYFDSYYFEEGKDVVKGKPSEQWFFNPANASDYEGYYQNWALKPNHRNSGTKTSLLTLKDKTVTNFEASVEYITAHTAYGLIVAPEGELPKANKGLKLSVTSEGRILVDGAIDVDSASWSGDGKCSSTGVSGIKGPALNGYIAPVNSWSSSEANKTSYILNVKVQDGVLTASVEGF